jgi:hypothetical protein
MGVVGLASLLYLCISTAPKDVRIDLAWSCFDASKAVRGGSRSCYSSLLSMKLSVTIVVAVRYSSVTLDRNGRGIGWISLGRVSTRAIVRAKRYTVDLRATSHLST